MIAMSVAETSSSGMSLISNKWPQNQRGTNSATMYVKNSGWSMSNFQDLPKKRNPTSIQHNVLFPCSEDVKLSYQRQSFCQFEANENNRNCG